MTFVMHLYLFVKNLNVNAICNIKTRKRKNILVNKKLIKKASYKDQRMKELHNLRTQGIILKGRGLEKKSNIHLIIMKGSKWHIIE